MAEFKHNDRIKALRTELQTLNHKVTDLYDEINEKAQAHEEDPDNAPPVDAAEREKLNNMIDAGDEKRKELEQLLSMQENHKLVNTPAHDPRGKEGEPVQAPKTWGQQVVASDQFKVAHDTRSERMERVKVAGSIKALYGSDDARGGAFVVEMRDQMVELPQRPQSILQLITVSQTDSDAVEYVEQTARDNQAATVAEWSGADFGLKPESDLTFALRTAAVRTIATWVPASRNILADAPQLRGIVDNELEYMLRLVLEDQILSGDGTGTNFTGILNTAGVQTRTQGNTGDRGGEAGDTKADALRRAITDIRLQFYEATGVVLNPGDGEDIELDKDANGQYKMIYDPATGRLWRLPVVESSIITAGTGLVGNFTLGVTLYDRMQTEIRVGEPNDYFLRNVVAVLAELRAALAVKRPSAFEVVTFV